MIIGSIIGEYTVEDCEKTNTIVENFLYSLKNLQPETDRHSNRKGWQKNNLQDLPQLQHLIALIGKKFEQFILNELIPMTPCEFYLGNMFCNINPPGAYHLPHVHEGDFTGVYYVKAPKNSGCLSLIHPQQCANTAKLSSIFKNIKLEEKIEPEAGKGYFFPTYLNHYVEENLSDDDRISISYNINVVKK